MTMRNIIRCLILSVIILVSSASFVLADVKYIGCKDGVKINADFIKSVTLKADQGDEGARKCVKALNCENVFVKCSDDEKTIVGCGTFPSGASCKHDAEDEECPPMEDFQETMEDNCIACSLLATILTTAQKISKQAFEATDFAFISLLIIGLLIFIAYHTLITIASPEAQKLGKYLTTIVIQGGKVAIAIALLSSPQFLYKNVLAPVLEGGVDFGITLLGSDKAKVMEAGSDQKYSKNFDNTNEYLSSQVLEALVGATVNFSNEATEVPALGSSLICHSWVDLGWSRAKIIPRIGMLIEGILLMVFGFLIWLAIGFYMIDCAIQLGLVCALLAFFIACWPFKLTSGYTKIGWDMFLNTFFSFVIMSVIIISINTMLKYAVTNGIDSEILEEYLHVDTVDTLDALMDVFSRGLLVLIVACLISLKLVKETGNLANKFAAGVHINMGAEVGALAAGYAQKTLAGGGKLALKGGAGVAKGVGQYAGSIAEHSGAKEFARQKSQSAKQGVRRVGRSIASAFGFKKSAGGSSSQRASFNPNADNNSESGGAR